LAAQLVDIVNFQIVLNKLKELIHMMHEENLSVLEEGALFITESLWTWEELFSNAPQSRIHSVWETLNDLGDQLQSLLVQDGVFQQLRDLHSLHETRHSLICG
jgi:hypothetical protein